MEFNSILDMHVLIRSELYIFEIIKSKIITLYYNLIYFLN